MFRIFSRFPKSLIGMAMAKSCDFDTDYVNDGVISSLEDSLNRRKTINDNPKKLDHDPMGYRKIVPGSYSSQRQRVGPPNYKDVYDASDKKLENRYHPKFERDSPREPKIDRQFIDKPLSFKFEVRSPDDRVNMVNDLNKNGFTIVRVMPESQALDYRDEFVKFVNKYGTTFNMYGMANNIAHAQFMWDIRLLTKKAFMTLYNVPRVITSFDRGCILHPVNQDKYVEWFHIDQQRNETLDNYQFQPVQGLVNLGDSDSECGLVLYTASHKQYDKYLIDNPRMGYGSFKIDINKMCEYPICPIVPIGCLVIWDSRMVHCNMSHQSKTRYYVCISMQPRHLARPDELLIHRRLFDDSRITGHLSFGPGVKDNSFQVPKTVKVTDDILDLV